MIFDNFSFSILINIFSDYGVMEKVIITFLIRLFLRPNLIKPNQSYILGLKEMPIVYPGCVLEETVWSLEEQERKKLPETPSIIPLSHHVKMLPHDPPLHIKKWKIKIKIKKIKLIIQCASVTFIIFAGVENMVNLVADVVYILGESLDTAGDELNKGKFNKRLS